MATIYPSGIKGTTGRNGNSNINTQKISNPENACNSNTKLASWGEYTPNNCSGGLTVHCNTLTTINGSFWHPEVIKTTGWNIPNNLKNEMLIQEIKVEYAYALAQYTSAHGGRNCGRGKITEKPVFTLLDKNNKTVGKGTGVLPSHVINMKAGTLTEHSVKLNGHPKTIGDLKKCHLTLKAGPNVAEEVCRLLLQYVRLKITYINPAPKYKLNQTLPTEARTNVEYNYKCTVNSQNDYSSKTKFYVQVPKNTTVSNKKPSSLKKTKTYSTYDLYETEISNKTNTITFTAKNTTAGSKTFHAYLSSYGQNKPTSTVTVKNPKITFDFYPEVKNENNSFQRIANKTAYTEEEKTIRFVLTLSRTASKLSGMDERVTINTTNFNIDWNNLPNGVTKNGNVLSFNTNKVILTSSEYTFSKAGTYKVSVEHKDEELQQIDKRECEIKINSKPLKKEFFKLRLEDGSDVQYNSLSFSRGDDLKIPLTYDIEDVTELKDINFDIIGESKRIPLNEGEYINFNISLKDKDNYKVKDVLTYIEAVDEDGIDCSDIIVGINKNGTLLESDNNTYCLINELSTEEPTSLKLAVQSDIERSCTIKLKPYNYDLYDTQWTPSVAVFKDVPNVKIFIDSEKNDYRIDDKITINYYIENKSDIDGKDLKFQIIEPNSFTYDEIRPYDDSVAYFNPRSRIITFNELPAHSEQFVFTIDYYPTKKGIYDFVLNTIDNINTIEDNQNKNSFKYQVLVGIDSHVNIKTYTNNSQPYVDELIDFTIELENQFKPQEHFILDIKDIGNYDIEHNETHYDIEYVDCEDGVFTKNLNDNNTLGSWELKDISANKKYKIVLSLRPKKSGLHVLHTTFNDIIHPNNIQEFDNRIKILEGKKQIDFNVYQAVIDDDIECPDIDNLIIICDDDYINLHEDIYYIFEITNNSKRDLGQNVNIYSRLPQSFLENPITCYSSGFEPIINPDSKLISHSINNIKACSTVKFFYKVTPDQTGEFVSNFALTTKTADVLNKQLHLTVDTEFNQREIEHEISIYNFEKTNRNYRYEIDNNGEIFKFFNKGDRSVRPIETEPYHVNLIERFKGSNLKKIVEDIKENSKYVDPIFLRIGNNKLADKGYEIYPDGFIRRFGLLKSEVFHHSNQLPIIDNLSKHAMIWDVDEWDTKVWVGYPYDNGVFDLTIDYSKIPSNFNILDIDNPINKLQNIVNKTKPYGTQGICYYSATSKLKFSMNIDDISMTIGDNISLTIKFTDMFLTTTLNRHDKSSFVVYDTIDVPFKVDYDLACDFAFELMDEEEYECSDDENKNACRTRFNAGVDSIRVYNQKTEKIYIEDIMDIVENLYNINNNTQSIDITMPYKNFPIVEYPTEYLSGCQFIDCINNCTDNQFIGHEITYEGTNIRFGYKRDDMDNFNGFVLEVDGEEINKRSSNEEVYNFSIGTQRVQERGETIIHFWGSINNKEYYHIGYINFINKTTSASDTRLRTAPTNNYYTAYTTMFNTDPDNDCEIIYKWYNGDVERTLPITFKITDRIKKIRYAHKNIKQNGHRWVSLDNINKKNKYAMIDYDSKECQDKKIDIPSLVLKYDTSMSRQNEIVDIDFTIKAQSNKNNFADEININVMKDGDYYYPDAGISSKIYYPENISNTTKDLFTNYVISQKNITICKDCLRTALGFYDQCPYCQSKNISHEDKTQPVTICESCGWVAKGTNKYCKHCLSIDVINVDVDYNKTYCNNCKSISNDYYRYCPKCFSSDTIYLDNKQDAYQLLSGQQNIKPIVIKTSNDEVNVFNIKIPFNKYDEILTELESLVLNVHYTNHNNGKYYYCPDCNTGGLGNFDSCPKCNSSDIINKKTEYNAFNTYLKIGNEIKKIDLLLNGEVNNLIALNSSIKSIDILSLAKENNMDSFDIQFYITNSSIDENINNILDLPIDDKYIDIIIENINDFDITIDNLTVDCVFKDNNNWLNLDALDGTNHTGLKYEVKPYENATEPLRFLNFNIPSTRLSHGYLYIAGICKTQSSYNINFRFTNRFKEEIIKSIDNITDVLFNYEIDLMELIGSDLYDIEVEVEFSGINDVDEIIITDCNILTQKETKTPIKYSIDNQEISYSNKNSTYIIKSSNMWGLNDTKPHYLSGRQLESNLLCHIDFGKLSSKEYIKLYDIYMTLYYKAKSGTITTKTIKIFDESNTEQYYDGQVTKNNGEFWGSIKETKAALNNLESQKLNIDEEGNIINFLPLYSRISQSFISPDDNINKIYIDYSGKKGYPSDIIYIYLFDDYNNSPNNIIAKNKVTIPYVQNVYIDIDFDVNDINPNQKYWIVIEDLNANDNNYHYFPYSDEEIGTLILNKNSTTKQSLCFSIESSNEKKSYYELPTEWSITLEDNDNEEESEETKYDITPPESTGNAEEDEEALNEYNEMKKELMDKDSIDEYKITNTLYRYNTNEDSNVYLSNISIKNGYFQYIGEEENEDDSQD